MYLRFDGNVRYSNSMKTTNVLASLAVIIIIIVVGMVAFKPNDSVAPTPEATIGFMDESESVGSVMIEDTMEESTGDAAVSGEAQSDGEEVATDAPATADVVTITIDEQGFTPANVVIAAGTTVTFVNNGQAKHWPASDIHPTHQILPEFDSKRGLATGETYSYTFTEVGEWNMHDHLNASSTGTITVQ